MSLPPAALVVLVLLLGTLFAVSLFVRITPVVVEGWRLEIDEGFSQLAVLVD